MIKGIKNKKFVIVLCLIFILIGILISVLYLLFYNVYNFRQKINSKPKIFFVSFGGPTENYYKALNRIKEQAIGLKCFDNIITYTDYNLKNDNEFWKQHGSFVENNKRGYGYWLWKPYIILQTLDKMQDNDILLYADAGCEILNEPEKFKKLLEKCEKEEILYSSTYQIEKIWNKMDLLQYMNMEDEQINSLQSQASFIFLKKTENYSDTALNSLMRSSLNQMYFRT